MLAPHHRRKRRLQASYICARAKFPFQLVLLALTVAALLGEIAGISQAASPPENWISTWAAPAVARTDQPAQTLSPAAQAYPWAQDVPSAVRGAASNQPTRDRRDVAIAHQGSDAPADRPCIDWRVARSNRAGQQLGNPALAHWCRPGGAARQGRVDSGRL